MKALNTYSHFVKIEHTLFSIPLLFAGAVLAQSGWPSVRTSILIVFAAVGARVVALALNRIFDRRLDGKNPRTEKRHLVTGAMKVWEAWLIAAAGLAVYLFSAWLLSNFCLRFSWIPLLGFTLYPFFKRFTKWTHVGLGLVWSLVPLAGFFAVEPSLHGIAPVVALAIFSVFWLAGFDIIYATMDEHADRAHRIHSLPAAWGRVRALRASALFHGLAFIALAVLYSAWLAGPLTLMLLGVSGVLLYLEHAMSERVDLAFFQLNVLIGFVVLFLVIFGIHGV